MREASIADAGDEVDQVNCSSEVKTLGRRGGERGGGYHLKKITQKNGGRGLSHGSLKD